MSTFYQLDIAAAALALVLLIIVYTRKSYKTLRRQIFKVLLIFNLLTSLLEISSVFTWEGVYITSVWAVQIVNILNIVVHFALHIIFLFYVIAISNDDAGSKKMNLAWGIVHATVFLFVCTNPLHHLVFTYSVDAGFKLRFGSYIINAISSMTLLQALAIFAKRKNKIRYESIVNYAFFVVLLLSVVSEIIFSKVMVENFIITMCFSMLTIVFDNPNKFFVSSSTVFNEYTFNIVYNKKIRNKTPFKLIAFNFADFDIYVQKIGAKRTNNIAIITANFVKKQYGDNNVFLIGRNVIVVDVTNLNSREVAKDIGFNAHKYAMEKNPEIKLYAQFVEVSYPDNIDNLSEIHDYIYAVLFNENFDDYSYYKFNKNLYNKMLRKKAILTRLYDAIANDGFEMVYQPIFNWKTNKFDALEALIRIKDDGKLGNISPSEFIPLAEQNGLIYEIDEIVFEKVCRFSRNASLKELGIRFVDVNMSLYKLIYPSVVDRYYELVQRYGIDPSFINLEITETAEGDEKYLQLVKQNIALFREKGFCFSLDDYGSGYSSVIYMAEMDTRIVKIDASIVWNAIKNKKYFTVLENCIRLVYCFDKECIAEGVENEQMITMLKRLGVNYFQGYYYSKPLTESEIVNFIKEKNSKKIR